MKYHLFNIGHPFSSSWWSENVTRGVITAGFDSSPGDKGEKGLKKIEDGEWIIAYCTGHGYIGAGIALSKATYKLHENTVPNSESLHRHERKVKWIHIIRDVANAVSEKDAGVFHPIPATVIAKDVNAAENLIMLIGERSSAENHKNLLAVDEELTGKQSQGSVTLFVDKILLEAHSQAALEQQTPISSTLDARVRCMTAIVIREGQGLFRQELLRAYSYCCAITGCNLIDVLEGAHIIPYNGSHTNRVDNGLLLRSDIHTLFDKGLIWVDEEFEVQIAPPLKRSEYSYLAGRILMLPESPKEWPHPTHLADHKAYAVEKLATS